MMQAKSCRSHDRFLTLMLCVNGCASLSKQIHATIAVVGNGFACYCASFAWSGQMCAALGLPEVVAAQLVCTRPCRWCAHPLRRVSMVKGLMDE